MHDVRSLKLRIVKRSLEKQAADVIRDSILSAELPLGYRLKEGELASQFSLSRSTIRTALHQLASEGLVQQVPYSGWCVLSLRSHDIWELYTLRGSLEALAARLAAARNEDASRGAIQQAFERLCAAGRGKEPMAIAEADFLLHRAIVDWSGNKRLQDQYRLVEQQVRLLIKYSNALIAEDHVIVAQHAPLVDAILAGSAAKAARLAEQHNTSEGEKLFKHARRLEQQTISEVLPGEHNGA